MATILTKKSDTSSSVPLAADLTNAAGGAELAVNTADKRLFAKTSGGSVVELGTNPSALTLPNGTANAVPYLNGSKVLTSGSALTFDGTALNVGIGGVGKIQVGTASSATYQTGFYGSNGVDTDFQIRFKTGITEFGTGTSTPLVFSYGGSEQMRLTSTGLGIGTSSPVGKLQVTGTNGSIRIQSGDDLEFTKNGANYISAKGGAAATLVFETGGAVERLRIDSSGNLGLGVTPSAWSGGNRGVIDLGTAGAVMSSTSVGTATSYNSYFDGANWVYKLSGSGATRYTSTSTTHSWYTAPSGTAGNAISFTQAMTLDASGNLALGGTSVIGGARADFRQNSNGNYSTTFTTATTKALLHLRDLSDVATYPTTFSTLLFGAGDSGAAYATITCIRESSQNSAIAFGTASGSSNTTERARIDSSGNLIQTVNTTAATLTTNQTLTFSIVNDSLLRISVRGSDGTTRTATLALA